MASTTIPTSVLRIGPSSPLSETTNIISAQSLLKQALVSFFNNKDRGNNADVGEHDDDDDDTKDTVLSLQNKYFTADVHLKDITDSSSSTTTTTNALTTPTTKEDGILLVFDAHASNPDNLMVDFGSTSAITFDSLTTVHEVAEHNNQCGDLLRLCIGVSPTPLPNAEQWRGQNNYQQEYSRRILWCLDRGYEYVEADLSIQGQTQGHDQRDKDGFARIIEAIQGTVWSSAMMRQSQTNVLKESYTETKMTVLEMQQQKQQEEIGSTEKESSCSYEPPNFPQVRDSVNEATVDELAQAAANKLMVQIPETDHDSQTLSENELQTEQMLNTFEGLLKEASNIRTASRDGTMSDSERRARAGDAAMALVNLMGQFGIDDDDDDEEEEDHDESEEEDDVDDSGVIEPQGPTASDHKR